MINKFIKNLFDDDAQFFVFVFYESIYFILTYFASTDSIKSKQKNLLQI